MGFSPGNFQRTGDPLSDLAPEAAVFSPADGLPEGVLMAVQKTEKGYAIEAAVPWTLIARLAKTPDLKPNTGVRFNFEVAISDTDGAESAQEKLMTILTTPWAHLRSRLMTAALATSDGKAPAAVRGLDLINGTKLPPGQKEQVNFKELSTPAGKESILVLKARLATPRASGHHPGMRLWLNEQVVEPRRLINRQHEEVRRDGRMTNPSAGDIFNVCYSPDYDAPDKHPVYALQSGAKLCQFELRVSDLLRVGNNTLTIANCVKPTIGRTLVVADVRLEIRTPVKPKAKRPAPTGPLDVVVPERRIKFRIG